MLGRLYRLSPWAICCILCASGCADTAHFLKTSIQRPFVQTEEEKYGIKTPRDRVAELRKMAKAAGRQPAQAQQQQITELAAEYRRENDGWVRREILRTLAQYPQPEAGAVLVTALEDPEVETRRVACAGLGTRGDKIAVQELARVLASDTDTDVRMAAVEALGRTRDAGALAPLSEALVDADPAMQAQAQAALVATSGKDYGNNVQAWRELAQTGSTGAAEVSYAERLRRSFY
jgi:HEAT repeat protein